MKANIFHALNATLQHFVQKIYCVQKNIIGEQAAFVSRVGSQIP